MFPGVHDSEVVAYSVDSRAAELTLVLAAATGSASSAFRLLFRGLLAHQFVYPQLPSIVFDLAEVPVADFLRKEWANLAEGSRQCGWPGRWAVSFEGALSYCESAGIKAFELQPSYGMSGCSVERMD